MKIAFVGSRGVPALYSGFETAVTEIGVRLVERGHEVIAYCRKGYGDGTEPEYRGIKKVYLPRIHMKVADTLSHTCISLLHACLNPPDAMIVLNSANGFLCVIPRLRRTPFAVNVDGLEWEREKWPPIGRKYFKLASWFCTKIAPVIIADSRGMADYYMKNWRRDSYFATYGAYLETSTRPELLEDFDVQPRKFLMVCARLEPENKVHLIVDAYSRVKTDMPLIVVGGTNFKSAYLDNLKATTDDPRVRFVGGVYEQDRLTELMTNCFAYIHGHTVGGTNPVLLKALGCGASVLYSDVVFNREVAGSAGIPFPLDPEGAAAVFQDLVDHPLKAEALRPRGPKRIEEAYTWESVTDCYERLCKALHERSAVPLVHASQELREEPCGTSELPEGPCGTSEVAEDPILASAREESD